MKSGFVAIIGRPNVGKSTLLNRLVGEKISGVSWKPQTTRHMVRGIVTKDQRQFVFLDTPGFHEPEDNLGSWMMKQAERAVQDADVVIWMALPELPGDIEQKVLNVLSEANKPVILLMNQIDKYPKLQLLPPLEAYNALYPFKELIPISAKHGDQLDVMLEKVAEFLPESEFLFPEDQISDQNERFIVREMIAEKLFRLTGQEIPYSTTVVIENFQDKSEKLTVIQASIVVERDSQKKIVIGEGGQKIKEIGRDARSDIEKFLQKKVFLELWVKVIPAWKKNSNTLRDLGYE